MAVTKTWRCVNTFFTSLSRTYETIRHAASNNLGGRRWRFLWGCIKFKPQFHFLPAWPFVYGTPQSFLQHLSVSGYQAVSGGNQQVDQSAWSVPAVQGIGRQVPHGSQVRRPPSYRALPQLQGKDVRRWCHCNPLCSKCSRSAKTVVFHPANMTRFM